MNWYNLAFSLGRAEHTASRLVFVFLLITYATYSAKTYQVLNDWLYTYNVIDWLFRITIILWISYWSFHTLEKSAYKKAHSN